MWMDIFCVRSLFVWVDVICIWMNEFRVAEFCVFRDAFWVYHLIWHCYHIIKINNINRKNPYFLSNWFSIMTMKKNLQFHHTKLNKLNKLQENLIISSFHHFFNLWHLFLFQYFQINYHLWFIIHHIIIISNYIEWEVSAFCNILKSQFLKFFKWYIHDHIFVYIYIYWEIII